MKDLKYLLTYIAPLAAYFGIYYGESDWVLRKPRASKVRSKFS